MFHLTSILFGCFTINSNRYEPLCKEQVAALVRALVKGPELLILVNPTSMLDEKETGRFVSVLAEQGEADQFAVLYSTWNGSQIIPADKAIDL